MTDWQSTVSLILAQSEWRNHLNLVRIKSLAAQKLCQPLGSLAFFLCPLPQFQGSEQSFSGFGILQHDLSLLQANQQASHLRANPPFFIGRNWLIQVRGNQSVANHFFEGLPPIFASVYNDVFLHLRFGVVQYFGFPIQWCGSAVKRLPQ